MKTLDDIDWTTWTPRIRATLLFVRRGRQVLLMRKKRGLGEGKINAPGGKIDPGETPSEAAVREALEEVGVRPLEAVLRGQLSFQFTDGLALHVWVYTSDGCEGEAVETAEALPMWCDEDAIPYDQMWADDVVWLPRMLRGEPIRLRALFDGDRMLDHALLPVVAP